MKRNNVNIKIDETIKITNEDMEFIHLVLKEYAKSILKTARNKDHIVTMSVLVEQVKECEKFYLKLMKIKKFLENLKEV